jgi:hypothetical protein
LSPRWRTSWGRGWPTSLPWNPEYLRILDPALPVAVVISDARTYTLSNPRRALIVAALSYLYRRVLVESGDYQGDADFWLERLSIVTPHRAQMATIRNLLVDAAGMPVDPPPFVDTVDRVQPPGEGWDGRRRGHGYPFLPSPGPLDTETRQ